MKAECFDVFCDRGDFDGKCRVRSLSGGLILDLYERQNVWVCIMRVVTLVVSIRLDRCPLSYFCVYMKAECVNINVIAMVLVAVSRPPTEGQPALARRVCLGRVCATCTNRL